MVRKFALLLPTVISILMPLSCALAHAESTLKAVKARGEMIAGVRFDSPPYGYVDDAGTNVGIDIDLAKEIAKRLGVKLELVQVTGQSRIPTLNSGKVDLLLAALTHTRKREEAVDFSTTYLQDGIGAMVGKNSGIAHLKDLDDKTVATVQGNTVAEPLKKVAPQAHILEYPEYPQAFLALRQGLADAFVTDKTILDRFLKAAPDFQVLDETLAPEPISIGIRKNDSEWRDALDGFIQDMAADGTWDRIVTTYVSIKLPSPEMIP